MNKKAFSLVEIMIVVAIIALLAAIAIPNLLRAKISANDALAKSTLRTLSTAAETYATTNQGTYPGDIASLTSPATGPAYVNKNYCDENVSGFDYTCDFNTDSYVFTATPTIVGTSGTKVVTIETGGILSE